MLENIEAKPVLNYWIILHLLNNNYYSILAVVMYRVSRAKEQNKK